MTTPPQPSTITLWDFSWYARTGEGDVFEDLERRCAEAVERGYDTVRICAMPFLLFGSGLPTDQLRFAPLGGTTGQGTRWYDMNRTSEIDGRAHLLRLASACSEHGLRLILSSWEYQQSSSLAATRDWMDALMAVPPEERPLRLADSLADLHDVLDEHGLGHVVLLTELHNEVQIGHLTDGLRSGSAEGLSLARAEPLETVRLLRPRLEAGLARFRLRRPKDPVTVNYAGVPVGALSQLPDGMDALVLHPYVYSVLGELMRTYGLGQGNDALDEESLRRDLLRPDAPALRDCWPYEGESWQTGGTIIPPALIHVHDWCDPEAVDAWLYQRWPRWQEEAATHLRLWMDAAQDAAASRGIPLLFGEGWFGYTPLHCRFEEGPVGAAFCELAMRESARVGAAGTIVCSNAAPHHPMWEDIGLQRRCNDLFRTLTAQEGTP